MKTQRKEIGEASKISGEYFFNEICGKWQIDIDCVDFELVDESLRFESKEEMQKEINKKYNVNLIF